MLLLREGNMRSQMRESLADNESPLVSRSYPHAAKPTGRREAGKSGQAGSAVCNRRLQCMLPVGECARQREGANVWRPSR
jgi:hypothetical protein